VAASGHWQRWSPHGNILFGFVPRYECDQRFASDSRCRGNVFEFDPTTGYYDAKYQGLSNEWNFTAGTDYEFAARMTGSFDLVARRLIDAGNFVPGAPIRFRQADGALDPRWISELRNQPGDVTSLLFVTGVKVNVAHQWLVSASVLFAGDTDGLKPGTAWVIGLERALLR
jgi:hypothetical protein